MELNLISVMQELFQSRWFGVVSLIAFASWIWYYARFFLKGHRGNIKVNHLIVGEPLALLIALVLVIILIAVAIYLLESDSKLMLTAPGVA